MTYWVYILASGHYGTLYVGVTRDLQRRVEQHRSKEIPGFTARYGVHRLVYRHAFGDVRDAHHVRKATQALATGLENPPDRGQQSALGGSLSAHDGGSAGCAVCMGPGQPLRGFRDDRAVGAEIMKRARPSRRRRLEGRAPIPNGCCRPRSLLADQM